MIGKNKKSKNKNKMIDSSYGYELRLWQKYSLCWFQVAGYDRSTVSAGSKFQQLRAEVQLLRVRSVTLQLSRVTAEVRFLQVRDAKLRYHRLREHTG